MENFAVAPSCRRRTLLGYFGQDYHDASCGACDICCGSHVRIDATREARCLLAAIKETGERFGAVHVCEVVTGAASAKVRERRHDQLGCFGAGKDKSKKYWRQLVSALLADGSLAQGDDAYPVPKLTEEGCLVLTGKRRFEILDDESREAEDGRWRRRAIVAEEPYHPDLFGELRALRKEIADGEAVPRPPDCARDRPVDGPHLKRLAMDDTDDER
jgi:ATP-dependent DNA helicase RecQ